MDASGGAAPTKRATPAANDGNLTAAQIKLKRTLQDVVTGQINITNEKTDRLIATQEACTNEMQAIKNILKSSAEQDDMTEAAEHLVRTLDESILLAESLGQRLAAVNQVLADVETTAK